MQMSKSAENDKSRVNLLDDVDTIVNKVKGAKTDAFDGLELDNPGEQGVGGWEQGVGDWR